MAWVEALAGAVRQRRWLTGELPLECGTAQPSVSPALPSFSLALQAAAGVEGELAELTAQVDKVAAEVRSRSTHACFGSQAG